jgi:hypothetical protein
MDPIPKMAHALCGRIRAMAGWGEEDVRDLLGSPPHFVTSLGPRVSHMELTTLLLRARSDPRRP